MLLIMNIIYNLDDVKDLNLFFSDKKNNILMEGSFTKLIHSDEFITTIGLYLQCPFKVQSKSLFLNKCFLTIKPSENVDIIRKVKSIETSIMSYYKTYTQSNKTITTLLSEKLESGNIKYYSKHNYPNKKNNIVLKISGIWESEKECGITFKFIEMKEII